jgi:hypothetical protein
VVTTGSPGGTGSAHSGVSLHPASAMPHRSARPAAVPVTAIPLSSAPQDGHPAAPGGGPEVGGSTLADAYGANVDFLATCLSCTTAQAGPNASRAEGRELRLAGESLSEGQVPANGYSNGALFVAPENPLLRLAIAHWDGYTAANQSSSRAHARGALLELAPADGGAATLTAGESTSDATYGGRGSRGSGESNGLRLGLLSGKVGLVVLHSESSSDSSGRVSVLSVNDQETLPTSAASGQHVVTVPGATKVAVLQSDGEGALIGSVSDGRSQRMVGIGSTRAGRPAADPQPLT